MRKFLQRPRRFVLRNKKLLKTYRNVLGLLLLIAIVPLITIGVGWWVYQNRIYPGIEVAGYELSRYVVNQAQESIDVLERDYLANDVFEFSVAVAPEASMSSEVEIEMKLSEFMLKFDAEKTVEQAYLIGRSGDIKSNLVTIYETWKNGVSLDHVYSIDENKLEHLVATVAAEINRPGAKPRVMLVRENEDDEDYTLDIFAGENGLELDQEQMLAEIKEAIGELRPLTPKKFLGMENNIANQEQIDQAKERAEKLVGKELQIKLDLEGDIQDKTWNLSDEDLVGFVGFFEDFDSGSIRSYVKTLAETVNREPVNASFAFDNGKVVEFAPSQPGLAIKEEESMAVIESALGEMVKGSDENIASLTLEQTDPEIETGEVNDLGIKELLGRGESTFYHSIPGRVHNVALTASKLNGVLVPPGEIFSFNKAIGDVSRATGYQSAYVIMGGRTVLGDGGGVCQDSTTLFRAIMDAGLPVVERRAHAYRVGYYEQDMKPGFDATVYAPSPDLKFENDTPGHILIQAVADTQNLNLVIDLYGTSDGREAEITNYQQWGAVPAPPPIYQDDPTLAPGVVKQVDWASPGLKVKFDYTVRRDSEVIFEETFYSNYRPWQAVYLRGV